MGVAYYIVVNDPDIDAFVNGKSLGVEGKRLARVAKSIGLKPLDEFVTFNDADLAAAAEDSEYGDEIESGAEQWFAPKDGLAWVSAMREYIRSNPKAVKNVAGVLQDLDEYTAVLSQAEEKAAQWHLSIDY